MGAPASRAKINTNPSKTAPDQPRNPSQTPTNDPRKCPGGLPEVSPTQPKVIQKVRKGTNKAPQGHPHSDPCLSIVWTILPKFCEKSWQELLKPATGCSYFAVVNLSRAKSLENPKRQLQAAHAATTILEQLRFNFTTPHIDPTQVFKLVVRNCRPSKKNETETKRQV